MMMIIKDIPPLLQVMLRELEDQLREVRLGLDRLQASMVLERIIDILPFMIPWPLTLYI